MADFAYESPICRAWNPMIDRFAAFVPSLNQRMAGPRAQQAGSFCVINHDAKASKGC